MYLLKLSEKIKAFLRLVWSSQALREVVPDVSFSVRAKVWTSWQWPLNKAIPATGSHPVWSLQSELKTKRPFTCQTKIGLNLDFCRVSGRAKLMEALSAAVKCNFRADKNSTSLTTFASLFWTLLQLWRMGNCEPWNLDHHSRSGICSNHKRR